MNRTAKELQNKIIGRKARAGVIGLGYVGLPLAVEMAEAGFTVTGFDIDQMKIARLNRGDSYIGDVQATQLESALARGRFTATADFGMLAECDTLNICVPTPLRKTRDPDLSAIINVLQEVQRVLHPGQLVILESTTYPGTTEEIVIPILSEKGLLLGEDYFLAFSPERVDPGSRNFTTGNIPKVVGGVTPYCTELAKIFYRQFVRKVVPVSSPRVAEMVKLLENTFRSVNIALVNELAMMCHRMGINVWEVIEAAETKPFGFMSFYPGPGIGGHCIPVDPVYLSWQAKVKGFEPRFIDLAGQINASMPAWVCDRITNALNDRQKCIRGSKILLLGISYKKDVADVRESPALEVAHILLSKGAELSYADPHVEEVPIEPRLKKVLLTEQQLALSDCAVILSDHSIWDYAWITKHVPLLIDTRNATRGHTAPHIVRL